MRESSISGAIVPATVKGRATKVLHIDLRHHRDLLAIEAIVRCAEISGFNHICVGPVFDLGTGGDPLLVFDHHRSIATMESAGAPPSLIKALRQACDKVGLALFVDIVLDRVALGGASAKGLAGIYEGQPGLNPLDPRIGRRAATSALLRNGAEEVAAEWWSPRAFAFSASMVCRRMRWALF
jgi:starch synthase (maltosyl-transferring)